MRPILRKTSSWPYSTESQHANHYTAKAAGAFDHTSLLTLNIHRPIFWNVFGGGGSHTLSCESNCKLCILGDICSKFYMECIFLFVHAVDGFCWYLTLTALSKWYNYRRLLRIHPPNNPPMGNLSEEKSTWALIWSKVWPHMLTVMFIPEVMFWDLGCGDLPITRAVC